MVPKEQMQGRLFGKSVRQAVEEALAIRLQLREMPIRDIRDVEAMATLDATAREKLRVFEELADAFIATVFAAESDRVLESRLAGFAVEADRIAKGNEESLKSLRRRADSDLAIDAPNGAPRTPFHWPLEFPEVVQRADAGFDAVVGNPPFMGGRLLGRRLGMAYQEHLRIIRNNVVGAPDLCAYFFLRAFSLLRRSGNFGLLATKSISETGTRVVCLDQILHHGGTIYLAAPRVTWPGVAIVVVSLVWVTRREWRGPVTLDGQVVDAVNGGLERNEAELGRPEKLRALKGRFSQGQDVMGRGFELDAEERAALLAEDRASADVIWPLFNGQDLNGMPTLVPTRWVIYFRDWPEEKARKYRAAFRRVEELVKPYRDSLTGQIHQDCFWKLWDLRPGLMREFATKTHVLALASVTKHMCISRVPTSAVYNMQLKILFFDGWSEFAVLQSSIHELWARWLSGTLREATTLRYSTSAVLETWPMPPAIDGLDDVGRRYMDFRDALRVREQVGLTALYNRMHDPSDVSDGIQTLRELRRKMDQAVLHAYGWADIDLELNFREVDYLPENDRVRFSVSEAARMELLKRLTALNRERHAEEAVSGKKPTRSTKGRAKDTAAGQGSLSLAEEPTSSAPKKKASTRRVR